MSYPELMVHHILSAKKVVDGKVLNDEKLIRAGVAGLAANSESWKVFISKDTTPMWGNVFYQLWERHLDLEGQYIVATFNCQCKKTKKVCQWAEEARQAFRDLEKNGNGIVSFLYRKFGSSRYGRKLWSRHWKRHLRCMKHLIDHAAQYTTTRDKVNLYKLYLAKEKIPPPLVRKCLENGIKFGKDLERYAVK